jgi:hypothetical protein
MRAWSLVGGGLVAVLCAAAAGCQPLKFRTAFGPGVDYAHFGQTFAWTPTAILDHAPQNPTLDAYLRDTVAAEFEERGYFYVDDGQPDFYLDYGVVRRELGGLARASFSGVYEEGSIIIEVANARTGKRVWRGYVTARLDESAAPSTTKERARRAIHELLERFPCAGAE